MPTYEYGCDACGHGFEIEQRITEDSLKKCPKCNKKKLKRLIGGGGTFILKGSGWYADLYSSPAAGSDSKGSDGDEGTSSSAKTSDSESPSKDSDKPKAGNKEPTAKKAKKKSKKAS